MAVTQIVFGGAGDSGGVAPLDYPLAETLVTETLVPVGTNTPGTNTAPAIGYRPICRIVTDTTVYVAIGTTPNALTDTSKRLLVLAGTAITVICRPGDKAAVVLA